MTEHKNVCTITVQTTFQVNVGLEELNPSTLNQQLWPFLYPVWTYSAQCSFFKKMRPHIHLHVLLWGSEDLD